MDMVMDPDPDIKMDMDTYMDMDTDIFEMKIVEIVEENL
jgi:hypothetical protein